MPDPVKKYKTPNNKIVSSDVLQEKYGDKFTELVNSGKLTEVTEPTYKTPNGLIVEESVLKNKYGEDQFKSLVDDNKFVLDYTPKKKSESQSTTSDTNVVSEAQDTDGSLATPENKTDPQTPNYAATDITTVKEDEPTQQVEGPVYDIDATIKNSVSENKYLGDYELPTFQAKFSMRVLTLGGGLGAGATGQGRRGWCGGSGTPANSPGEVNIEYRGQASRIRKGK